MQKSPEVSIIIPVLNQKQNLKTCLDRLFKQIETNPFIEIVVVDNGSTDGTWELIQQLPVCKAQILHPKSPYACKNKGTEIAGGQIFVFLDSTLQPSDNWLNSGLKKLDAFPDAIITGNSLSRFNSSYPSSYELVDCLYMATIQLAKLNSGVPCNNIFLKKSIWEKIGCFENTRSLSDIEWSRRALSKKIMIIGEENAIAFYTPKKRTPFIKKAKRMGFGRKQFWTQNKKILNFKLIFFAFKLILPPNPVTFYNVYSFRFRSEFQGRFFSMYWVAWHFKFAYLTGLISSSSAD